MRGGTGSTASLPAVTPVRSTATAADADVWLQRDAAVEALDHLQRGLLVTDEASHVLFSNRTADRILRQEDGLYLRPEGLGAARPRETADLRALVRHAAIHDGDASLAVLSLWRPSLKRMLLLRITSLRGHSPFFASMLHRAAIFLHDPAEPAVMNTSVLSRLYGLTQAESRLVVLLLNGSTLPHAAEAAQISLNTARTHLQRVFMKTDTNHQTQLVKLLLGSVMQFPDRT